ncbi:hypothetical protein [Archangium violaceum]|uniref:hypothetical protein n=1 Tax=Archangium violaceum TaxID=83451 RepID=UPI001EF1096A|nr:hypothetical protein [Archangium violaceum]
MVLVDVLEEYQDEAAFRWVQWERALVAPDFTLAETAEREERLLARLEDADALDTVGRPKWRKSSLRRRRGLRPRPTRCWRWERWRRCWCGCEGRKRQPVPPFSGRWG